MFYDRIMYKMFFKFLGIFLKLVQKFRYGFKFGFKYYFRGRYIRVELGEMIGNIQGSLGIREREMSKDWEEECEEFGIM